MWILSWWRWLCGYVEFSAVGGLCERFLSLLAEADPPVRVWKVRRFEDGVTAVCRVRDYRRLRPMARRTGTRVRHQKHRGADRWMRAARRRPGLWVGAVLAMAVYMLLASAVWVIDIPALDPTLTRRIEASLAQAGLTRGVPIRLVDTAAVRMQAVASIEELHQLSVYFDGCVAKVEVRLQEDTVSRPDTSPANIVAAEDGRILSAQVTAGQPMMKVGEAVVAGDLLVCGAVETEAGTLFRHAAATILAQTEHTLEVRVKKADIVATNGQVVRQPTMVVFGVRIPLFSPMSVNEEWTAEEKRQYITWQGTPWPIGIEETVYTEHIHKEVSRTEREAEVLAGRRLLRELQMTCAGAQVMEAEVKGRWEEDVYILTGTYTCVENIAKTVPLLTDRE